MTQETGRAARPRQLVEGAAGLAEGERMITTVADREIGIFRIHGELRAWENRCPHQGGPVCTGLLVGRTELVLADDMTVVREERSSEDVHIACPWHGWEFDIDTGVCWALPIARLRPVQLEEDGGEVYVHPSWSGGDAG